MAELTSTVRRQKLEVRKKQTFVSTGADEAKEPSRTEAKIRGAEETRGKLRAGPQTARFHIDNRDSS